MRKVVLFMVMSLDGFVCGEHNELDWEIHDDSVSRYLIPALLERTDAILLGRSLYKGFEQFWPEAAKDASLPQDLRDFACWIERTPKIVFSSTLTECPWEHSRLVKSHDDHDIAKEVADLKREDGKDMTVFGGARFAQTLVRLGLVDELQLKVQPIALGAGKALFSGLSERMNFKLIDSKAFDSGVVAMRYECLASGKE